MNVQPEVRAIDGYPVVLPCTFTHPQNSQHASLQVVWRLGRGQGARVLYRCTSRLGSPSCDPRPHQDERYRLEGNPREHDLSLWINSVTLQDSGRYYCGVEVDGRERVSFEDQTGTRLRVEGRGQKENTGSLVCPYKFKRDPPESCHQHHTAGGQPPVTNRNTLLTNTVRPSHFLLILY